MIFNPDKNPFLEMFQTQYEKVTARDDFSVVEEAVAELVKLDDGEMRDIFANELGNTWSLYREKMKGKNDRISAIVLKWDGGDEDVPSLVFSDAYDEYRIESRSESTSSPLLYDTAGVPLYVKASFGEKIFEDYGGFDIDFVTYGLYAVDEEDVAKPVYREVAALYTIKTLDLAYNAVLQSVRGDRFRNMPVTTPFAFFALPEADGTPVLLLEIASL